MDTRIALSGANPDVYGALMRGWQGAEQRIQDVNAQQDRAATISALSQRYGNSPESVLMRTAPDTFKIENDQVRLGIDQQNAYLADQKYNQEQMTEAAPMLGKMLETLKSAPAEHRPKLLNGMVQSMSRINPVVARELATQIDDLSDEGLAGLAQTLSVYTPEPEKTTLMQNIEASGKVPGTPEYQQAASDYLAKPNTSINMPGERRAKLYPKAPAGYGYRWDLEKDDYFVGENGMPVLEPMTGAPLTEGERKMGYVARSLEDFENELADIASVYPEFDPTSGWNVAGAKSDWLASPAYQQYRSAADEWTTNTVFLRSGATAREEEKESAFRNYFPQPGNDAETVTRKNLMRQKQTLRAINMAGRAFKSEAERKTFYVMIDGKRESVSWDDIVTTAEETGKTPQQVIVDLDLKDK